MAFKQGQARGCVRTYYSIFRQNVGGPWFSHSNYWATLTKWVNRFSIPSYQIKDMNIVLPLTWPYCLAWSGCIIKAGNFLRFFRKWPFISSRTERRILGNFFSKCFHSKTNPNRDMKPTSNGQKYPNIFGCNRILGIA